MGRHPLRTSSDNARLKLRFRTGRPTPFVPVLEALERRDCPSLFVDAPNTGIVPFTLNDNNTVSWLDFNGDGRPDLWIGGEIRAQRGMQQPPSLYINQGNGQFTDTFSTAFPAHNQLAHVNDGEGAVWADVFNTGNPDLLQVTGTAGSPSFFFRNNQGLMSEQAAAEGLANSTNAGRAAIFLDWNRDGLPDALFLNQNTIVLDQQTPSGFVDATAQAGIAPNTGNIAWAQSVDLNGDGLPDLLLGPGDTGGKQPLLYLANASTPGYTLSSRPFGGLLPSLPHITDVAIGDFFNTGTNDLFFVRRDDSQSDVEQSGPNLIAARMLGGPQTGFTFASSSTLTFDFAKPSENQAASLVQQIFIGSQGYHPAGLPFTLDPANPANQGIMPHDPNNGQGLYLGYDPAGGRWQVDYAAKAGLAPFVLNVSQPATGLTPIGFDPNAEALRPYLLVYDPTTKTFVDRTAQVGLATPLAAGSVVAGDFNNDGYLDIFVSTEHILSDQGGILYLNNGDGTFRSMQALPAHAGLFYSETLNNVGRRVITADYNGDGTLDLFFPTTKLQTPSTFYNDAPNELVENTTQGNQWIELNLQGVQSNRDALGAVVYLTAGEVTQRRDVTGGRHLDAQDSNTVAFGLGTNTIIDRIVIHWPSGIVQTLTNVPVDRIMTILESDGPGLAQGLAFSLTATSPVQNTAPARRLDRLSPAAMDATDAAHIATAQALRGPQDRPSWRQRTSESIPARKARPPGDADLALPVLVGEPASASNAPWLSLYGGHRRS